VLVAEGSKRRPLASVPVSTRRLRVLVVEDHEVLRNGLRWLLTRVPWVERAVAARDLQEALRAGPFDVGLVDVSLGLAVCEHLSASGGPTAVLVSRWDDVPLRVARGAGARGVIAKELAARELLAAVRELACGGTWKPPAEPPGEVRFAPREREILRLVSAGLTNAEIGASLYLAPGTIKHHMLGLFDKLGAPNRAAAVHTARRLGLLADCREPFRAPLERVRVLVADPVDVRRAGVLLALQGRSWVATSAGARTVEDARDLAERLRPELVLAGSEEMALAFDGALRLRDDGTVEQPAGSVGADSVSPRERDVLTAFAAGATNPAIAVALGLSPNTVKQHASSIFRKLGVRNRAEAVRRADELGLLAA
jgi:DNA-binding NarL/FixJ family response regulator